MVKKENFSNGCLKVPQNVHRWRMLCWSCDARLQGGEKVFCTPWQVWHGKGVMLEPYAAGSFPPQCFQRWDDSVSGGCPVGAICHGKLNQCIMRSLQKRAQCMFPYSPLIAGFVSNEWTIRVTILSPEGCPVRAMSRREFETVVSLTSQRIIPAWSLC